MTEEDDSIPGRSFKQKIMLLRQRFKSVADFHAYMTE
jgi:hypothetical protein